MKIAWKSLLLAALLAAVSAQVALAQDAPDVQVVDVEDVAEAEEYDEYADDEDAEKFGEYAFLITKKYIKEEAVVAGEPFSIVLEVHNAGKSVASQIAVTDSPVHQAGDDFKVAFGSPSASFDILRPGSSVTHTYSVVAGTGGLEVKLLPALIEYKAFDSATEQQSSMSTSATFYVKTASEKWTGLLIDAGRYASLGMVTTPSQWLNLVIFASIVGGGYIVITTYRSLSVASQARKRKAAEAALLKEE